VAFGLAAVAHLLTTPHPTAARTVATLWLTLKANRKCNGYGPTDYGTWCLRESDLRQQRAIVSSMAADWHELMTPRCIVMRSSIACH